MDKTIKIYEQNPYLREFNATVIKEEEIEDKYVIVLDQTAFYPTGGGQPHDTGTISGIPVLDVYKKDGIIYHILSSSLQGKAEVTGEINWERRFDHMQQHAGQHILSRAFEVLYQVETVGFHLGEEWVTIDLNTEDLSAEMLEKVEQLSNQVIMENRPISIDQFLAEELTEEEIRKIPELDSHVRIVNVNEFDSCACAGTHPEYTGEIGFIKLIGTERIRKNVRLSFVCGFRAVRTFSNYQNELNKTASLLKTNVQDVYRKTEALLEENNQKEMKLRDLKTNLSDFMADEWIKEGQALPFALFIEKHFKNEDLNDLRVIVQKVTIAQPAIILLTNIADGKVQILVQRSEGLSIPANDVLKIGLEILGGKGGGNPKIAQGGSNEIAQFDQAVQQMKNFIMNE